MSSAKMHSRRGTPGNRPRVAWIWISIVIVAVVAGVVWRVGSSGPESTVPSGGETIPAAAPPIPAVTVADAQGLVGRWVRTDSPYVLEIASTAEDGSLVAAYYNPRPINVSRAAFRVVDGTFEVFVELRDVNYPGSTYTLRYDAANDVLQGVYFQAALGQSYDVTFAR
ncbi:MAG: hypothetical protein U9Q95_01820 [Candidatus Eisenbacteria bacterium]|nr:hypothetical protein [Candidatus Eisenbacteria bacterium]